MIAVIGTSQDYGYFRTTIYDPNKRFVHVDSYHKLEGRIFEAVMLVGDVTRIDYDLVDFARTRVR